MPDGYQEKIICKITSLCTIILNTAMENQQQFGNSFPETDERDVAKKLLQLEKDCAYYMLKDLIFDDSVQFKAGQPLVLQESECQQLVLICPGNNSSGLVEVQFAAIKLYVPC
ncbi:hypothetical protein MIR68_006250 [Amoeboaphelidium protococcarum]|nr:hypothetical protein MIR68_006250 [Amoeboaphelidium protococcarum]